MARPKKVIKRGSLGDKLRAKILDLAIQGKLSNGNHHWIHTTLGKVCNYGKCKGATTKTISPDTWSLDLKDIEKNTGRLLVRVRTKDRPLKASRHAFKKGQVLFNKLRTYLNKVLIADEDGICTTEIVPLDFKKEVLPEFAKIVLMSSTSLDYTATCVYGDRPRLSTKDGKAMPFLYPPTIEEQKEIADKVEALLAEVDHIREAEKIISLCASRLRASILQNALQGKLTRGNHHWIQSTLGDIFDIARGGSPRPIKAYITTAADGLNWIKIGDAVKGSKYITSVHEKIKPEGLHKTRRVYKGDLILSNSMSYGQPYILAIDGCIHDGWLVLHPKKEVSRDFFVYLLSSDLVRRQFATLAAGGVVENLNSDKVRSIKVSYPPSLAEQEEIVGKVEALLAEVDHLTSK